MGDVAAVAAAAGLFGLCALYVRGCRRLIEASAPSGGEESRP